MEYKALYRKFRPTTFEEVVGQEHITKTLKNQIISNRVGHAYLFNGGRGTGKTSTAKILARAINCLNPKDGEPCNECEICKASIDGSLTDVVEMDAASNNSVEDIRSIREEVNFLPTLAKYRVYIIDEVHMLSIGAFNALLKTLEEPPEHVKFILATTEPQRLPATILSRCQRFDFKKISNENLIKRLKVVCSESNIEITEEALNIIAVLSEGAMRDALSILERCIQDGDTNIDENKVRDLVGIPKLIYINRLAEAIIESNVEEALQCIDDVLKEGKDILNFLWEEIKYIKDILVYKTSKNTQIYNKSEIEDIQKLSENVSKDKLLNIIYQLSELENDIKMSSQKIIIFQTGIIKLCTTHKSEGIEELEKRIETLENAVNNRNVQIKKVEEAPKSVQKSIVKKVEEEIKPQVKEKGAKKQNEPLDNNWKTVVNDFKASGKIMLYTNLMNTSAKEINDMTIGIEFPNGITPFGKAVLEKTENINEIEKQVSIMCGKEMRVKFIDAKKESVQQSENAKSSIETFAKDLDVPFSIIEE